jgi:hypothetical protein
MSDQEVGAGPALFFVRQGYEKGCPSFFLLESWAPRTPRAAYQAVFRTLISAFCFSFASPSPVRIR